MDPIGQVNPLLEALRRQLAENIERMRKAGRLGAAPAGAAREPGAAQTESLEAALRRRVGPLERRTPEGRMAATRAFVETVLMAEFGRGLLSDAGFGEMLNDLTASLREDPALREQIDSVLGEL
jgi:hypothetical protein